MFQKNKPLKITFLILVCSTVLSHSFILTEIECTNYFIFTEFALIPDNDKTARFYKTPLVLFKHSQFDFRYNESINFPKYSEFILSTCHILTIAFNSMVNIEEIILRSGLGYSTSTIVILNPTPSNSMLELEIHDLVFAKVHVTILLNIRNMWSMLCYFCNSSTKWIKLSSKSNTLNLGKIRNFYNKLNEKNGYSYPIFLSSRTPGEAKLANDPNCAIEKYHGRPEYCHTSHVILQMLKTVLNMTSAPTDITSHKQFKFKGLYICILCIVDITEFRSHNSKVFYYGRSNVKYTYCYQSHQYRAPKWTIVIDPFDKFVWICVILTAVLVSMYHWNFWNGVDVLCFILGQTFGTKWNKLISLSLVPFSIILYHGYQGVVVVNMMKPLEETNHASIADLKGSGYKFVVGSKAEAQFYGDLFASTYGKAHKSIEKRLAPKESGFFIHPEMSPGTLKFFKILVESKGYQLMGPGAANIFPPNQWYYTSKFHYRMGNINCAIVDENLPQSNMFWFLTLHYSDQAYRLLNLFKSSGIFNFWTTSTIQAKIHKIGTTYPTPLGRGFLEPRSLSLHSSLKILFYLYLMLNCLCIMWFVVEYYYRIHKKFWSYKFKRKKDSVILLTVICYYSIEIFV